MTLKELESAEVALDVEEGVPEELMPAHDSKRTKANGAQTDEPATVGKKGKRKKRADESANTKSTNGNGHGHSVELEIDPDNILDDPEIVKLREWSGESEHESRIPELARMILEEKQTTPGIVRETADGYMLVDGYRRKAAIKQLKDEGNEIAMRVVVREMTDDQAMRAALLSFTQKENLTGMEFAHAIKMLRARFHMAGKVGTGEIAAFLGVSPATVTQAERLLETAPAVQQAVKERRMRTTAALEVATSPAEVQEAVVEEAGRIAEEEANRKPKRKQKSDSGKTPVPAPVTTAHVRKAQRVVPGAMPAQKAARIADVIDLFAAFLKDAAHPVLTKFAETFMAWAHGTLKEGNAGMMEAWRDIADDLAKTNPAQSSSTGTVKAPTNPAKTAKRKPAKKVAPKKVAPKKAVRKAGAKKSVTKAPAKKAPEKQSKKTGSA